VHATTFQNSLSSREHRRDEDYFRRDMAARQEHQHDDGLLQCNPSDYADGLLQSNPFDTDIVTAAQAAANRLISGQSWQDWRAVGCALQVGRTRAMAEAGTNRPEGKRYSAAFSRWISDAKLDKVVGGREHNALRSRLLDLVDHLGEVERWRATLPPNQRVEWNYPATLHRHWQKPKIKKNLDKPPSAMAKLKQSVADLEEENHRLKEANGGNTFTRKDSARDVVMVLRSMFSEGKLREICKLLGKAE
jgi:hypothetical protein